MKKHIIRVAAFGFIAFLIILVSIANSGEESRWWPFLDHVPYGDKLGHFGLFGTLCFLCNLAFPSRKFGRAPFLITLTSLVLLTIITLEELSQLFIPSRHFDTIDLLADYIGLTMGQVLAGILNARSVSRPSLNIEY